MSRRAAILLVLAALAMAVTLVSSLTAGNVVPATRVGITSHAISANTLKPAACSGLDLATRIAGVNGTAGNDLLLGGAGDDVMDGGGGNDCIRGGGGSNTIDGGPGTDVCLGGTVYANCETTG